MVIIQANSSDDQKNYAMKQECLMDLTKKTCEHLEMVTNGCLKSPTATKAESKRLVGIANASSDNFVENKAQAVSLT